MKNIHAKSNRTKVISLLLVAGIVFVFLLIPHIAFAKMATVSDVLNPTKGDPLGTQVKDIWGKIINVCNGLIVGVLIFVAFAQILRLNLNTYGVKKVLPTLILAIIAANFSYLFCRLLVDFSSVLSDYILVTGNKFDGSKDVVSVFGNITTGLSISTARTSYAGLGWYILGSLFIMVGAVLLLILAYLFVIRNYLIYFMVALAPIAFLSLVLPQTKSLFNQWWTNFSKWVFMPVVSLFWLWLGSAWFHSVSSGSSTLIPFIFSGVCFYLAITTPFKMGGAVMSAWGNYGKKAWNSTAGNAWKYTGGKALNNYGEMAKTGVGNWYTRQGLKNQKWNPISRISRSGAAMQRTLAEQKKAGEGLKNDLEGSIIDQNRRVRERINRGRPLGGGKELAEAELDRDYSRTGKGSEWVKKKAGYQKKLSTAKQEFETELAQGEQLHRAGTEGEQLAARTVVSKKRKEMFDNMSAIEDKMLETDFHLLRGMFENDPNARRLSIDYFNVLARNKTLDEAVSNSSSKKLEAVLGDQIAVNNMAKKIKGLNDKIQEASQAGDATEVARLTQDRDRVQKSAMDLYKDRHDAGFHHLDETIQNGKVLGFAGMVDGDEELAKTLSSRAGKLLGIEINADIDKILDRSTPQEIASELQNGGISATSITGVPLTIDRQMIENFFAGKQDLNDPNSNREIETRLLALGKVGKQANAVDGPDARIGLLNALPENMVRQAAAAYNKRPDTQNSQINEQLGLDDLKKSFVTLLTGNKNKAAWSSIVNLETTGFRRNNSEYLSGGTEATSSSFTPENNPDSPMRHMAKISTFVKATEQSGGSFTKIVKSLGANEEQVVRNLDDIKNTLRWEKLQLAESIGRQVGINLNASNRKLIGQTLSSVPRGTKPEDISSVLNEGLKKIGATRELSPNQGVNIQTIRTSQTASGEQKITPMTKEIDLQTVIRRNEMIQGSLEGAKLLSVKNQVEELMPRVEHFAKTSQADTLKRSAELNNLYMKTEDPTLQREAIPKMVYEELKKDLIAGPEPTDPREALEILNKARKSAALASQAFDTAGNFDINKARDIAAKEFTKNV